MSPAPATVGLATAVRSRARAGPAGPVCARRWTGALLLGLAAAAGAVVAAPAGAEERLVTITSEGVVPARLEVELGDTVRFVSQDPSFAYRAESTGGPWSFDSGPTELLDGDYAVPAPVVQPGTYTYRVAQDPPFHGTVVVPGPAVAPVPSPPQPPSAAAVPTAVPTVPASPGAGRGAPPPADAAPAVPGQLPAPPSSRALGLPVALAVVLLVGTASLLLRLLLVEAGQAGGGRRGAGLSDPRSTLRAGRDGTARW